MAEKVIGEKPRYKYEAFAASVGVTNEVRGKIKEAKTKNYFLKSASDVILWLFKFQELNNKIEFVVTSENPKTEKTIRFEKLPEHLSAGWKLAGYRLIESSEPFFRDEK